MEQILTNSLQLEVISSLNTTQHTHTQTLCSAGVFILRFELSRRRTRIRSHRIYSRSARWKREGSWKCRWEWWPQAEAECGAVAAAIHSSRNTSYSSDVSRTTKLFPALALRKPGKADVVYYGRARRIDAQTCNKKD